MRTFLLNILLAAGLVALAILSRFMLLDTYSRWQIAAFWLLAALLEWGVKPRIGLKARWLTALATAIATTLAILAVRWHVEGLCPHTWPQCASYPFWRVVLHLIQRA